MSDGAVDPAFRHLIDGKGWPHLEAAESSVYGIWPDFRLAYCNPAWFRIASREQGEPAISQCWHIGASILDAMTPE
ncbi:MAG: hypothetical protein COS82_03700 [Zetaproteobacteria bacterium CG06_land_8_20_14_3_00_59_53]|nr:MAG: hypothetical protein AUK36_00095 [Zetaproteobacteria bacterium CG2_30_59_37]PIO89620.1 MAG: hypothetical protein COX56_07235 [Zetaproteobacteria bacterium CG23_combo_of_CG06-09_8_20_14_all_59_86]PIQ65851.1 MAG: hypothetical protein COV97_02170 [Zetaproteobacteria bacterium CG11_big_fil_rev_8_21_14_0_20_59_439]PIU71004.1 MAG: hypothetical protein COS82_03700 [Zetaproteobacteria bacterium CG06_land_8_20_14_3_00_59_53]PIU97157.1 MAG: hypothetical protein COS62_05530 [Zetaproteobacteria bac